MSNTINFGIDLGTTNSMIAKFQKGTVNIFKNPVGWKETLPSVVAFRNERILVGEKAREYFKQNPKSCAAQFKRKMGTSETFPIGPNREPKTPVDLSSLVLKELKSFVSDGERVESAVITVPASFDVSQCGATTEAANLAGISQVVLLQEPIAASLAYANQTGSGSAIEGKWLVYDLGGGTFDVALVDISSGEMKVVDHEGDNFLGGADFDLLIVEKLVIPFLEEKGYDIDFAQEMRASSGIYNKEFHAILIRAEEAKKELSTNTSTLLEFEFDDDFHELEIVRSDLESIVRPAVSQTVDMVRRIMTSNSLRASDLNFILMVGGATYMPYVRRILQEQTGIAVRADIDPTTAIGVGAAFYAGTKEREAFEKRPVANSRNIEIRAVYSKTSKESEELFSARVSGDVSRLFYRVKREDGGFDSGLLPLNERITMDLPLVSDSYNHFVFKVVDEAGDEIPTNFNEITIAHNLVSVYGQPIPHDISIELDDTAKEETYLRTVFRKSTILPTKSSVQTVKTTRNISKGSSDDAFFILVKEGPSDYLPEALDSVGTLKITGKELKRDLLKGSDVEIVFEMSESREIKVSAYIPFLDQSFQEVFAYKERDVDVEILQSEIESLDDRVSYAIYSASEENYEFIEALERLQNRLSELRDKADGLAVDDATDTKYWLDSELRAIAQELNFALKLGEVDKAIEDYRFARRSCGDLVAEAGNQKDSEHFEEIIKAEEMITSPPSVPHLRAKETDLWRLYMRVRYRQPSYWTEEFDNFREEYEGEATPRQTQLIKQGKAAVEDGDYVKLREVVEQLREFSTKQSGSDGTVTGIG